MFENEEGVGMPFHREKSELSREERIKLVKQRRERGGAGSDTIPLRLLYL